MQENPIMISNFLLYFEEKHWNFFIGFVRTKKLITSQEKYEDVKITTNPQHHHLKKKSNMVAFHFHFKSIVQLVHEEIRADTSRSWKLTMLQLQYSTGRVVAEAFPVDTSRDNAFSYGR